MKTEIKITNKNNPFDVKFKWIGKTLVVSDSEKNRASFTEQETKVLLDFINQLELKS